MLSRVLHPAGVPVGLALLAVALLVGVGLVSVHETNDTALKDAQERVQSNRDAAVRALVHQTIELKRAVGVSSL